MLASVHFEEGGFYEAGLAFSPEGDRLAFATDRGEITVLEVSSGEVLDVLATTEGDVGVYPDVAFSPPDGSYLAATGRTWVDEYGEYWSAVMVWDLTNMDMEPLTLIGTSHWAKTGVTFSPDGSRLMVGTREGMGGGGSVKIWDTASGENQLDIPAMDWITDVTVFPDGSILAGSSYGIVILWDAFTGEELDVFQVSEGSLWGVAFSPDGNLLAVRSALSVYLLNPGNGEILSFLDGQIEITSMAFSPNGRMLVTADGQTIRLWDVTTGEELAIRETGPDPVLSVTFSPDGRAIASATAEGVVYLWGVGP